MKQSVNPLDGDSKSSQPGLGYLDKDLPFTVTGDVHPGYAIDQHQFSADIVDVVFQFTVAVTRAGHSEHQAEHVAKIVEDYGFMRSGRQFTSNHHVTDPASKVVPFLLEFRSTVGFFDLGRDLRKSGAGCRNDFIKGRHLLQSLLDRISDLFFDLLGRSAGIADENFRVLDRKGRVFKLTQRKKGRHATDTEDQHQHPTDGFFLDSEL